MKKGKDYVENHQGVRRIQEESWEKYGDCGNPPNTRISIIRIPNKEWAILASSTLAIWCPDTLQGTRKIQ